MDDTFTLDPDSSKISKEQKNDDTNYDTFYTKNPRQQLIDLLRKKEILREREAIRILSPKEKEKTQKISVITIKRAIRELEKKGILIKVKQKQLREYGIFEKDKGAVYLALKEDANELRLIEQSISLLESGDKSKQKIALEELKDKISMRLKQPQIDKIVLVLKTKSSEGDDELLQSALNIISESVKRGIIPSIDNFGSLTNFLYNKYQSFNSKELQDLNKKLISDIIILLGLLEDKRLIDIIRDQINTGCFQEFYSIFTSFEVSKVIVKYDQDLFDLQVVNRNNNRIVSLIREIRKEGAKKYNDFKTNLLRSENAIREITK